MATTLTTPTESGLVLEAFDAHPDGIAAGVEAAAAQISAHIEALADQVSARVEAEAERAELTVAGWLIQAQQEQEAAS